uniref:hypothetical protein n=1 Tax=Cyanophyceae TaxID=3028117 RepID=UPI000318AC4C|nr:hypothetical protein [Chroococcidiopsis sp. TS-821]
MGKDIEIAAFGVEGTGSYGKGLSQFLRRQGLKVIEVSRPCRRGQQRLQGKDELLDAEDAARQVLAGQATAIPKSDEGAVEMIRILKAARDTAVKAQTQVMVSLKALIVTADAVLRAELEPLSTPQLIKACQHLEVGTLDTPMATMRYALAAMAKRWTQLHKEIEAHTQHLIKLTQAAAPELVQAFGIGTDTEDRNAAHLWRECRSRPIRSCLCQDVWSLSDSSVFGQNPAPSLKPRRQSSSQCCFVSRRHCANAVA